MVRIALDRASIGMADDENSHAMQIELPERMTLTDGLRHILRSPFLVWASDTAWVVHGAQGPLACLTQTLGADYQPTGYSIHLLSVARNFRFDDGMKLDFQPHLSHAGQLKALVAKAVATQTIDATA